MSDKELIEYTGRIEDAVYRTLLPFVENRTEALTVMAVHVDIEYRPRSLATVTGHGFAPFAPMSRG